MHGAKAIRHSHSHTDAPAGLPPGVVVTVVATAMEPPVIQPPYIAHADADDRGSPVHTPSSKPPVDA